MKTSYTNNEYTREICARYVSPRVKMLASFRAGLNFGKENPLIRDALFMHIIVTCHQLISFLGVRYLNDTLAGTEKWASSTSLEINVRNCGGNPVNVNELTNIRKNLLIQMLKTAEDIRHLGYTQKTAHLEDLYLNKGGIDYLLLLLKQNFYDQTEIEFPLNAGFTPKHSANGFEKFY